MPVKQRVAKERRPAFSAEIIELFVKLEHTSRRSQAFKNGSKELARLLGLSTEWWMMQHVNDRAGAPPPWLAAHAAWQRCRAVREQLLAASGLGSSRARAVRRPN
jgi:hypothetical protein